MAANSRKQKSLRRIEQALRRQMTRQALNVLSQVSIRDLDIIAEWLELPTSPDGVPQEPQVDLKKGGKLY